LERQKNLPALLNVFALLCRPDAGRPDDRPQMRLRLIGEGSQRADLMSRARELGIEHWVDFYGAVPRERVREAIQSCHLFCFTSTTEGQCLASLEILAEGRPIIATSVGAFPDTLTNPALGEAVPSPHQSDFLSALKSLLARQKGGLLCPQDTVRAYRAKFDGEAILRSYVEVLRPAAAAQEIGHRHRVEVRIPAEQKHEVAKKKSPIV
jgi:glycosyltransferase involved in cell wall biosynthesis